MATNPSIFTLGDQAKRHNRRRLILYLVVIGLLAYAVIPELNQLTAGIRDIRYAQFSWLLLALLAIILTHMAAALTYVILAKHPIKYLVSLAVQVAASFTNRLLPSGLGGISLFIYYLTKKGHSPSEATSVTAMNSVVSITSHLLLLLLALDIGHTSIKSVFKGKTLSPAILLILVVAICLAIIILKLKPRLRQKVQQLIQDVWRHILNYRHQPLRVLLGLISAGLVTVFYVCAFYTCAHAMGLPLGFAQAFLIYTLGILLGAAALTPGGLGGLEAGLVTGLVAFGYSTATAFAVVIIYRLITFWLPILPGYLSFWLMRKHQVI